jgi:hypothetical protein
MGFLAEVPCYAVPILPSQIQHGPASQTSRLSDAHEATYGASVPQVDSHTTHGAAYRLQLQQSTQELARANAEVLKLANHTLSLHVHIARRATLAHVTLGSRDRAGMLPLGRCGGGCVDGTVLKEDFLRPELILPFHLLPPPFLRLLLLLWRWRMLWRLLLLLLWGEWGHRWGRGCRQHVLLPLAVLLFQAARQIF